MVRIGWRRQYALAHWAVENLHRPEADLPEDWPEASRFRTHGAFPTYCGEYAPGLTGPYAILNGLKLLVAEVSPLKPSEEQMLLQIGCDFMSGRDTMTPHRGLRLDTFVRMAEAMAYALSRRRGAWIQCERMQLSRKQDREQRSLLERSVVAKRVVLILLGRGHYSVLRGFTLDSWLLFDATGRQWMLRRGKRGYAMLKPILMLSRAR